MNFRDLHMAQATVRLAAASRLPIETRKRSTKPAASRFELIQRPQTFCHYYENDVRVTKKSPSHGVHHFHRDCLLKKGKQAVSKQASLISI